MQELQESEKPPTFLQKIYQNLLFKQISFQIISTIFYFFCGMLIICILSRLLSNTANTYGIIINEGLFRSFAQKQDYLKRIERSGVNLTFLEYFLRFIKNILTGDWGESTSINEGISVGFFIGERIAKSFGICILTLVISIPVAVYFGKLVAKNRSLRVVHFISAMSKLSFSIPPVFFGYLIKYMLGEKIMAFILINDSRSTWIIFLQILLSSLTLIIPVGSLLFPEIRSYYLKRSINYSNDHYDQSSLYIFKFGMLCLNFCTIESLFDVRGFFSLTLQSIIALDIQVLEGCLCIFLFLFLFLNIALNLIQIMQNSNTIKKLGPLKEKESQKKERSISVLSEMDMNPTLEKFFQSKPKIHFIILGATIFFIIAILAFFGPILFDKSHLLGVNIDVLAYDPPGKDHLLGTTKFGRDVFGGVLNGIGSLLKLSLGVTLIGFLIGVPIGLIFGFKGGFTGKYYMFLGNLLIILPLFIVLICVKAIFGNGSPIESVIQILLYILIIGQLTHNLAIKHISHCGKKEKFTIFFKEIYPQLIPFFFSCCTFVVLMHSSLSFYGYSNCSIITLGNWMTFPRDRLYSAFWAWFWPGCGIFLVCLSFMLLSYGFSDLPKKKGDISSTSNPNIKYHSD